VTPKLKQFVINTLRGSIFKWLPRRIALESAEVSQGDYTIVKPKDRSRKKYKCAHCKGIFRTKEINVDHIEPVVDPETGFTTFDEYIQRMFCKVDGFQVLCKPCHDVKTQEENSRRKR
jgi:5-methylcytosine-specific restriction endonuclease McrA